MNKIKILTLIFTFALTLTSCSTESREYSKEMTNNYNSSMQNFECEDSFDMGVCETSPEIYDVSTDLSAEVKESKIIKRYNFSIETKEFDKTIFDLENFVKNANGRIESSENRGFNESDSRYSYYVLRIPTDKIGELKKTVSTLGNVLNSSENSQDISRNYYDNESKLEALKIQEDRLLEILKKTETVDDLITLENELSRIRYQIESITSTQITYNDLVEYATVSIDIMSAKEYTVLKKTLGEKISDTFKNSFIYFATFCQGILLVFINILPFLITFSIIIVILILFIKKRKNKNVKLKTPKNNQDN